MKVVKSRIGVSYLKCLPGHHSTDVRLEHAADLIDERTGLDGAELPLQSALDVDDDVGEFAFGTEDVVTGGDGFGLKRPAGGAEVDRNFGLRRAFERDHTSEQRAAVGGEGFVNHRRTMISGAGANDSDHARDV